MKTLYLDCFAGISIDRLVGALFELFPDLDRFKAELGKITRLSCEDYEIRLEKGSRNNIAGTRFYIHTDRHSDRRNLGEIEQILTSSTLSPHIQREAMRAFALLAGSSAQTRGTTPDKICFDGSQSIETILGIAGTFILIDRLGWPKILSSPVNVGSGTVKHANGLLPVPAPETELLLHGLPVCSQGGQMERTTPAGALLVRCLADGFSEIPAGTIAASGYGIGTRDSDLPDILRVLLMKTSGFSEELQRDRVALLECNIDDMNPQDFQSATEKLFKEGALDVWLESISMKKGRPGVKLCCLCPPEKADPLSGSILKETTTQGIRKTMVDRSKLCYKIDEAITSLGPLRIKTAFMGNIPLRRTPEYDDLKRLAQEHGLSLPETRNRVICDIGNSDFKL